MYLVKLFIILIHIFPPLLTWIPFFDVLALSEVLEIHFLEYSRLCSEKDGLCYAEKTVITVISSSERWILLCLKSLISGS